MEISPRYGTDPVISLDGPPSSIAGPTLRQRRRLADLVQGFGADEWSTPSRCEGWTVQDVVAHLVGVDRFWDASIRGGVAGAPTRFLAGFDPKATPAAMVAGTQGTPVEETRDQLLAASGALCATIEGLGGEDWSQVAESPVGHVPVAVVLHHALWDCWVHEWDILLPLGIEPTREDDEIAASLRYAAALGPALALDHGGHPGQVTVAASEPSVRFAVVVRDRVEVRSPSGDGAATTDAEDAIDNVLAADAVELLEALSVRGPWPASATAEQRRVLGGLDVVFEATTTS